MSEKHLKDLCVLIGTGGLNKNTLEEGLRGAYSKWGAYWKEGAKSNHYRTQKLKFFRFT